MRPVIGKTAHIVPVISIHAPRAGCDDSTNCSPSWARNFNPRTPCGVRPQLVGGSQDDLLISIHAPRAGCDCDRRIAERAREQFQSTHPVRGATLLGSLGRAVIWHFNPRTPCGVRPGLARQPWRDAGFQSTHPVRGATSTVMEIATAIQQISIHAPRAGCDVRTIGSEYTAGISIHAPRAGCDTCILARLNIWRKFQSTHPVRGATAVFAPKLNRWRFQSTHPVRGATKTVTVFRRFLKNFNPRTPCGVRRVIKHEIIKQENFNPRTPCGVRHALDGDATMLLIFQSTHPVRGATLCKQ